jgi:hypothetical protein
VILAPWAAGAVQLTRADPFPGAAVGFAGAAGLVAAPTGATAPINPTARLIAAAYRNIVLRCRIAALPFSAHKRPWCS